MATTIVTKSGSGAPTASDLVAGELAVDLTNKRLYTEDSGGTVLELGTNPSGNVTFGDNGKAIFGAESDLQIYHDGSNSYIKEDGAGNLIIAADDFRVTNVAVSEVMISADTDGVVNLYHNGSVKLATTSSGIDVTGSVTSTGIVGASDGTNGEMQFGLGTALTTGAGTYDSSVRWNGSSGNLLFSQGAVEKMRITSTGIDVTGSVTADGLVTQATANTYPASAAIIKSLAGDISYITNVAGAFLISNSSSSDQFVLSSAGNVGIGTSTPTAARLQVKGTGTTVSTNSIFAENSASAGLFAIRDNGDAFILGNTGIGTTPIAPLHVKGTTDGNLLVRAGSLAVGTLTGTALSSVNDAASATVPLTFEGSEFNFVQSNAVKIKVDSSGNVGIGGVTDERLTVTASNPADGRVASLRNSGTSSLTGTKLWFNQNTVDNWNIGQPAGVNAFVFCNSTGSASERMRIDASGRVGIGGVPNTNWRNDIASQEVLMLGTEATLFSDGGVTTELWNNAYINNTDTVFNISTRGASRYQQYQGAHKWFTAASASAGANINTELATTPKMTLDVSGNLLAGATSTTNGGHVLKIASGTVSTFETEATTSTNMLVFRNGNGNVGTITTNGTTTTYNTSSDQRLKDSIADADDAGSKIDAIQVRKFDWKADGSHQDYGMVAQELQAVAPEAVSAPEDPEDMMGVDYSKLVPMMLKEIQSLRARIAALES